MTQERPRVLLTCLKNNGHSKRNDSHLGHLGHIAFESNRPINLIDKNRLRFQALRRVDNTNFFIGVYLGKQGKRMGSLLRISEGQVETIEHTKAFGPNVALQKHFVKLNNANLLLGTSRHGGYAAYAWKLKKTC